MSNRFELIVFDWDGTLSNSADAIATCIQLAARDLGLAPPTDDVARHVIGLGLHDALKLAIPELAPNDYGRLVERYRAHFLARDDELVVSSAIRCFSRMRHSGARISARSLCRLRGPEVGGVFLQAARVLPLLRRAAHLVEEAGMNYLAESDPDYPLKPLQAASRTNRIALGPRAGLKVLTLRTVRGRDEKTAGARARMRTASACMRGCAAARISARNSNVCAATSRAP